MGAALHHHWISPIALIASLVLVSGCASTSNPSSRGAGGARPSTGDPVVDGKAMVESVPEKDKVLWQYRTALNAMRRGQYAEARVLLDSALVRINNIFGPDKSAKKSRSYFKEESKKTFVGEPYERAMANYYRGILYWMDGEPDNARACFRNGQYMDSDAEEKTYSGDYVLFDYLDGFVSAKLGADGGDYLKRARQNIKNRSLPDYMPKANVLFFLEYGPGPQKYATGEYGEQLHFRDSKSPVQSVLIRADGKEVARVGHYDDVFYQASTRGGRVMDHVLANKAVFKSATDTVGNVAVIGGAVMTANRGTREAGLAVLGAGLISKIVSSMTTPAADTRAWDNLPHYITFAAVNLAPGAHRIEVDFLNENGAVVTTFQKQVNLEVKGLPSDTVVFVSDQSVSRLNL